jgi:hypothetical protein
MKRLIGVILIASILFSCKKEIVLYPEKDSKHKLVATYYVKNSGSNSNTGLSDAQAWQTLSHVPWNSLVAGDVVNLNRGDTWREQISITSRSGSSGSWITIGAYGTGAKPKILGSVNGDVGGYWTSLGGSLWASANNSFPLESSVLYYDTNAAPKASTNKATQALLTTNWDLFYDSANHRVIVYLSTGSPDTQANGIEIAKPFTATYNEGTVSVRWCQYLTIQNLDIRYSNSYGIKEAGGSGGTGAYNTFLNCEVHYTWDKGGNFVYGDHIVIDGCIFDHLGYIGLCPAKRSSVGSWGEAIWVQLITYPTVRYTEMAYPHNNGIDIWGCSNGLVENCYSHDVDYPLSPGDWETGIYMDGSSDCIVRNNLISNLVIGISVNAESSGDVANNLQFYNNIVKNCDANYQVYCNQGASNHINNLKFYHNISYHDTAKRYDSGWWAGFYIANCTTVDLKNNVVYNQLSGNHLGYYLANTALTVTSDYNDFYLSSYSGNFHWNNGNSYATLATWQSGSGQDVHSYSVNPLFVTNGTNFSLQSTSPLIGKGVAITGQTIDYAGIAWKTPPSIGAYEYVSTGGNNLTQNLADSITLVDSNNRVRQLMLNIVESSLVLTDSTAKQTIYNRVIPDSVTLNDVNTKIISTRRADTLTLADSISFVLNIIGGKTLADTISLSDSITTKAISKVLSDNITLVDAVYPVNSAIISLVLNEFLTLSDSVTGKQVQKVVSDNIVLIDVINQGKEAVIADSLTLSDNIGKQIQKVLADSITVTDNSIKLIAIALNDGFVITDNIALSNIIQHFLTDNISLTDNREKLISKIFNDGCVLLDGVTIPHTDQQILSDNIILSDILSAVLVQPAPPRRRCTLLEILRKGFALFHFTNDPLITNTSLGDSPNTTMPDVQEISSNDTLSRDVLPGEGDNLDLGEHRV